MSLMTIFVTGMMAVSAVSAAEVQMATIEVPTAYAVQGSTVAIPIVVRGVDNISGAYVNVSHTENFQTIGVFSGDLDTTSYTKTLNETTGVGVVDTIQQSEGENITLFTIVGKLKGAMGSILDIGDVNILGDDYKPVQVVVAAGGVYTENPVIKLGETLVTDITVTNTGSDTDTLRSFVRSQDDIIKSGRTDEYSSGETKTVRLSGVIPIDPANIGTKTLEVGVYDPNDNYKRLDSWTTQIEIEGAVDGQIADVVFIVEDTIEYQSDPTIALGESMDMLISVTNTGSVDTEYTVKMTAGDGSYQTVQLLVAVGQTETATLRTTIPNIPALVGDLSMTATIEADGVTLDTVENTMSIVMTRVGATIENVIFTVLS
ncbi:MAG: hypothetical protein SVK08_01185 [Halobacteriota archaeon]|nr:hypothetical protein [Halobacteriota archaeon]